MKHPAVMRLDYRRPMTNSTIRINSTTPTSPLGPYPQLLACGHTGKTPISARITTISRMVPRLMICSFVLFAAKERLDSSLLHRVSYVFLEVAIRCLRFANMLLNLALLFELLIAHELAGDFLDLAFDFLDSAFDLVFVDTHGFHLMNVCRKSAGTPC